ncbi:MAG: maleylpyruvate isomerase N-terminal domain-containing protein [Chloroflexota bacterium]
MNTHLEELHTKLSVAYTDFLQTANQLDVAKRDQSGVCGEWTPREVVAHLTGWDASLCSFITDPEGFDPPYDAHAFNAQSVAKRQSLAWEAVVDELERNFADLERAIATITPEMKPYQRVCSWMQGRTEDYKAPYAAVKEMDSVGGN